jgi:hypothetical protein
MNNNAAENPGQAQNSNVITVDFSDIESVTRQEAHRRTLQSITARHSRHRREQVRVITKESEGIISTTYEYPNGTPTFDMPESVLDGKLGEICQQRMSIYPVAYAWPALVTAAGALVQPAAKGFLRTNLYTCLVGDVASGKSSSIELAFYLLDARAAGVVHSKKAGSAEGLLGSIGEQTLPVVLALDEMAHLLAKAQIENASFPTILNSLFYEDEQEIIAARHKKIMFNARLSILGGIVTEKFEDSFAAETVAGLFDRFLFGVAPSDYECNYRPPKGEAAHKADPSKPLLRLPEINGDVWERKDEWIRSGNSSRTIEIALRVAAICAAFDGRKELKACDLEPAMELARYQEDVRRVLKPDLSKNQNAKIYNKLMNYLQKYGDDGGWISLRDLKRRTHIVETFGPEMVVRVLNTMKATGAIDLQERETAGRSAEEIRLLEREDE